MIGIPSLSPDFGTSMSAVNAEPPNTPQVDRHNDVLHRAQALGHARRCLQLHAMPLAIVEAQGVASEPVATRHRQRGRRIQPSAQQTNRGFHVFALGDASIISEPAPIFSDSFERTIRGRNVVKLMVEVQRYYFDHNATTPVSAAVLEVLVPALLEVYGNASSIHRDGQLARQKLEAARRQTAALLHADPKELVFLSGGTEADNLAILGTVRAHPATAKHVITTAIEHPAVLNTCRELEREGVAVTYVRVGSDGVVDPADVRRALRPETVLVSVMHVNNELGTIQPIEEICGHRARGRRPVCIPTACRPRAKFRST